MTWGSFMDFAIMRTMNQEDSIYRNYDLLELNGSKPGQILDRAFARMGFDQKHTARAFILPMINQRMHDAGFKPPNITVLEVWVREWYNWDRIRKGELVRWKLKVQENPLLI